MYILLEHVSLILEGLWRLIMADGWYDDEESMEVIADSYRNSP